MKKIIFSALGCLLSFQCFASELQQLDELMGLNSIHSPDYECRMMKCLKCGK